MALIDDVELRIPAQVLVSITNPDDNTATGPKTSALILAVSDIQTYFETYAQEAYSSLVPIHALVCVKGVRELLSSRGGGDRMGSSEFWDKFRLECERVRDTRARARIVPSTNSQLTPSQENQTDGELRPWSDSTHFTPLHTRRQAGDDD